jgi:hypothetical protein
VNQELITSEESNLYKHGNSRSFALLHTSSAGALRSVNPKLRRSQKSQEPRSDNRSRAGNGSRRYRLAFVLIGTDTLTAA